jgi:alpha-glucosidase
MGAWWRDAVIYQVYARGFADGDGDGVGDLIGVRDRLPGITPGSRRRCAASPAHPTPPPGGK